MTNTDAIRELTKTVSTLEERLNNARAEIGRVELERSAAAKSLVEIDRRLAVIEATVKELKRIAEEKDRRRSTVLLTFLGCLLTLAANIGLTYFRSNK